MGEGYRLTNDSSDRLEAATDGGTKPLTIGIVSDTHGLLRSEAIQALIGVDHILHAGDVGDPLVLDKLRWIAPLTAICGNVDRFNLCSTLPVTDAVELGGRLFYLVHSVHDLDIDPIAAGVAVVVSGHTHRAEVKERNGVLYLNPGSAGPRRFDLPVSLAKVNVGAGSVDAQIVELCARRPA
jgi:putative phosphoesterase